jgi:hypothetical protein
MTAFVLLGLFGSVGIGKWSITKPAVAQVASDATTTWVGIAPDGGLMWGDGSCAQDVEFELTHSGETLLGWAHSARVTRGDCQPILSQEQPTGQRASSRIVGTLHGSAVSLWIFQVRTRNGVPNRVTVLYFSGTVEGDQLIAAGGSFGPRTWADGNRNGSPDCDFAIAGINGECGTEAGPARALSVRAIRRQQ